MSLSFDDEMAVHRAVTLRMAGVTAEQLTAEQLAALDRYEGAYREFFIAKWGKAGPHGSVLRMEEPGETEARIAFEASIRPLQERLRMQQEENNKQCVVCEKEETGVPFIWVEVSQDEMHYEWLAVCGENCLQQVILRWKQISEIVRPDEIL